MLVRTDPPQTRCSTRSTSSNRLCARLDSFALCRPFARVLRLRSNPGRRLADDQCQSVDQYRSVCSPSRCRTPLSDKLDPHTISWGCKNCARWHCQGHRFERQGYGGLFSRRERTYQIVKKISTRPLEPRKRAHSLQLDFDELSRVAAGLASVSEYGKLPYGRRFPVPTRRDCRDLQSLNSRPPGIN
jgi:hypothetical protein